MRYWPSDCRVVGSAADVHNSHVRVALGRHARTFHEGPSGISSTNAALIQSSKNEGPKCDCMGIAHRKRKLIVREFDDSTSNEAANAPVFTSNNRTNPPRNATHHAAQLVQWTNREAARAHHAMSSRSP